jgi:GNAT superfamily N-acetyltransferase
MSLVLLPPESLTASHQSSFFDCGEPALSDWLVRRALANHNNGASRVFVVADQSGRVYGYYALAAGAVSHSEANSSVRRNMPDPIPVIVLGRLAVDLQAQGIKLGAALLQDAIRRTLNIAESAGVKAILVHALNQKAKKFYEYYGFQPSVVDSNVLMLKLASTR